MATRLEITKWGNSLAVRNPKLAAQTARLKQGDQVEVLASPGKVELRPIRRTLTLQGLVRGITPENCHAETEWGVPAGRELW